MSNKRIPDDAVLEMKRLRDEGLSFEEIGRQFGFTGGSVHCAIDAAFAAQRREKVNANRQGRAHAAMTMRETEPREQGQPIALTETYSIRPYVIRVPNRTALGTSFLTEKAECHFVSLPRLSIQGEAV